MGKLKFLLPLSLLLAPTVFAEPQASPRDLQKIDRSIKQTGIEVQNKKEAQAKINREIRETERELRRQRAELDKILKEKKNAVARLNTLQGRAAALRSRVEESKTQIERLLAAQYRNRDAESVVLMLQNTDANEKGRQLRYYGYVRDANREVMLDLLAQRNALRLQEEEINGQIAKIQDLIQRQRQIVGKLTAKKQAQLSQVDRLDDDISQNEKKIRSLKNDQKRLSALLRKIDDERREKSRQARETAVKSRQTNPVPVWLPESATEAEADKPTPAKTEAARASDTGKEPRFSSLQGKLAPPVSGKIIGRFGTPRAMGGVFNGLYFAGADKNVQVVAAGDVVYAADLRGYGNTVIVDHDHTYITIYAGLSSLATEKGRKLRARQNIGRTGALPGETDGLYFELRYHTNPLNPAPWLR